GCLRPETIGRSGVPGL
ncbi:unnamed protein product, partial [Rotaria magnacalcarata]